MLQLLCCQHGLDQVQGSRFELISAHAAPVRQPSALSPGVLIAAGLLLPALLGPGSGVKGLGFRV